MSTEQLEYNSILQQIEITQNLTTISWQARTPRLLFYRPPESPECYVS